MADFCKAFAKLIELEGGFVDDPDDSGGVTKYGISFRFLKNLEQTDPELADLDGDGNVDKQDIAALTIGDAAKLYKNEWWDRYGYHQINHQGVANKLMDMAVNMGAMQAHKLLQRAINTLLNGATVIDEDGILGPQTSRTFELILNSQNPDLSGALLLIALKAHQEGFYRLLVAKNPDLQKFLDGWVFRARS